MADRVPVSLLLPACDWATAGLSVRFRTRVALDCPVLL